MEKSVHVEMPKAALFHCPNCKNTLLDNERNSCSTCGISAKFSDSYADLIPQFKTDTSDHYSKQWGGPLGFLKFLKKHPSQKKTLAAATLDWHVLFDEIRSKA